MTTLDGFVISKVTKQASELISAFADYCPESSPHYDRVKVLTKKLMSDFDGLSSTLFHLADTYKGLFDCTENIVTKHQANDFSKLNESYLRLSNLMTDWGNTVTSQIQVVQDNIYAMSKYDCRQYEGVAAMMAQRSLMAHEYSTYKQSLIKKIHKKKKMKGDYTEVLNLDEAELSQKDCLKYRNLRHKFGFYNDQTYQELQ